MGSLSGKVAIVTGASNGEVFGTIRPATTIVEVKRLIDPDMLVEIEAGAILAQETY